MSTKSKTKSAPKPLTIAEAGALGGRATAKRMTKKQRSERARLASKSRWANASAEERSSPAKSMWANLTDEQRAARGAAVAAGKAAKRAAREAKPSRKKAARG